MKEGGADDEKGCYESMDEIRVIRKVIHETYRLINLAFRTLVAMNLLVV